MTEPLVCRWCDVRQPASERFCPDCGMPLVLADPAPLPDGPRQQWARKVKPQYGEGRLVRVAGARNQPEAELIQGLLLEEGVPSLVRRTGGFDVPDFLASGPRDVLVPQSGAVIARELLGVAAPTEAPLAGPAPWVRALAVALAVLVVAVLAAAVMGA